MTISREVLKKYSKFSDVFIETGTHIGNTTQMAFDVGFKKVYTIELSKHFYDEALKRFSSNENIICILGDSTEKLEEILNELDVPAVFWLDGHWSMGNTAKGNKAVPILEELEVIKKHHIKNHVILIDDLRLMGNIEEPIKEWSSISLEDVKNKCLEINSDYKFSLENGHVPNDIFVVNYEGCISAILP